MDKMTRSGISILIYLIRPLVLALIVLNCSAANAIECRASNGKDGWWMWRIIDGQKCWYRGRKVIDKTQLHWPAQTSKPTALEGCCWPPLERR